MAESSFVRPECALIDRRGWCTKTEAWLALFTSIEGWHKPRRRHSALDRLSWMNYEAKRAKSTGSRTEHRLTARCCAVVDNPAIELTETAANLSP
jgi:hypothetical protein